MKWSAVLAVPGFVLWATTVLLALNMLQPAASLNMSPDCTADTPGSPICLAGSETCDRTINLCVCNLGYFAATGNEPAAGNVPDTCLPCPPGKYKDQTGDQYGVPGFGTCLSATCCVPCPAGKFMFTDATETASQGSKSVSECKDCNDNNWGGAAAHVGKLFTSYPGAVVVSPGIWSDVCFYQPTGQPTSQPSTQPSSSPSAQPTGQPTSDPSGQPTAQPSGKPSGQPSMKPSGQPTSQPTGQPSCQPTSQPTSPTGQPTSVPSGQPSSQPTSQPTSPTGQPTRQPSGQPTSQPTMRPSGQPSSKPTSVPSGQPSAQPSCQPTSLPSGQPTSQPSMRPSGQPSSVPSSLPTGQPSGAPSYTPTSLPTSTPEADAGGVKVASIFFGFWLFFLVAALLREYQQSKRLLNEKKVLALKASAVAPDSRPSSTNSGGKNGRKINSHGTHDTNPDLEAPAEDRNPRDIVRELLQVSLARIFEGVFSGTDSNLIKRLEFEIEHNHAYLMLFWSRKVGIKRWINVLKLLTSLSVAALSICLIYDYHFPSNDGSCYKNQDEATCYQKRLGFDSSKRQCRWQLQVQSGYESYVPAMCTFNNSPDVYELDFFIYVMLIVVAFMAVVNFFLDLTFEHIIAAPATNKSANVEEAVAQESLRLKYHKKVQAQLLRLNRGIIQHREELLSEGRIDDLDEFDAQWGVNLAPDGAEEIIWMDKISSDLYEVVKRSQELRFKLNLESEMQCGTELLYLFAIDLMGRNTPAARIFANKTEQSVKNTHRLVSIYIKLFFVVAILVGDGVIFGYLMKATRHKLESWMTWTGFGFLAYVIIDFISIEGCKIAFVHFLVPNAVAANAVAAQHVIEQTLEKMCDDNAEDSDINIGHLTQSKFSVSDHLFVATRVAKHFPGLFESAVVLSYREPLPKSTCFYWGHQVLHSLRAKQSSSVRPTMGSADGDSSSASIQPPPLPQRDADPRLRDLMQKKAIQDVVLRGEQSESFFQQLSRSTLWVILEFSAMMPIEVQKFLVHLIQPAVIYGVVQLVYVVMKYLTIGIYIVVILAVALAVMLVLHLSYEQAETDALEEEAEEEEREASMANTNASGYAGLELSDRLNATNLSTITPNKSKTLRRPSFDSEDGDLHDELGGSASLFAALKTEALEKKHTLHSTALSDVPTSALKSGTHKIMNIRSLMASSESKVSNSPQKPGLSLLERQLDIQEHLDEQEFRYGGGGGGSKPNPFSASPFGAAGGKSKGGILGRIQAAQDSNSKDFGGEESIRGAESVGVGGKTKPTAGLFDHEHDDVRFSRTPQEMEKELAARLAQSKPSVRRNDMGDKVKTPGHYNSKQVDPSLRGDRRDREPEDHSLSALLKSHGHGTGNGNGGAHSSPQPAPAKSNPFKRR